MGAAEAVAGAGDDGDASIEAERRCHGGSTSWGDREGHVGRRFVREVWATEAGVKGPPLALGWPLGRPRDDPPRQARPRRIRRRIHGTTAPSEVPMRQVRTAAQHAPSGPIFDWNRRVARGRRRSSASRAHPPRRGGRRDPPRRHAERDRRRRAHRRRRSICSTPWSRVGVDVVSVGLPAAGARYAEDTDLLCREIRDARLPLIATAAARTVVSDVEGVVRASDRAGLPIEVYAFVGQLADPPRGRGLGRSTFLVEARARRHAARRVKARPPLLPRHRGHDALAPRRAAHPLPRRGRRGREPPLPLRHHRARHALRRRGARPLRPPRARRDGRRPRRARLARPQRSRPRAADRALGGRGGRRSRARHRPRRRRARRQRQPRAARPQPRPASARRPRVPRERLREYCELAARALCWTIPPDHPHRRRARFQRERRRAAPPTASSTRRPPRRGPRRRQARSARPDHAAHRRRRRSSSPSTRAARCSRRCATTSISRHEAGLRQGRLRRVHRHRRRQGGALVPHARARRATAARCRRSRRSAARRTSTRSSTASITRRRPVRLLHARHADERDRAPRPQPRRRRATRSSSPSPATSAAAPATAASSTRSRWPRGSSAARSRAADCRATSACRRRSPPTRREARREEAR